MRFFSARSLGNLMTVHQKLQLVAELAIGTSEVDFAVIEGKRDFERQRHLVETGASQTLNSRHLTGRAIDVMACIGDQDGDGDKDENWQPGPYFEIARGFQLASEKLDIGIVWGGVWDRELSTMSINMEQEYRSYVGRRGGKSFFDPGHFELAGDVT